MSMRNALLVVAIDFGTTYSGYAIQFRHDYDPQDPTNKIQAPQPWNGGRQSLMSHKTPTCLLLNDKQEIDSFGYEAEERYADLCMNGENKTYYYYRRFKMRLQEGEGLKLDSTIEDETGKSMPGLKVFSLSIQCLKDKLMEMLHNTKDVEMQDDEILWVLTVPAIWDDAAKGFMVEAAKQAGIKEEHLSIALEPEAASLFCQFLPVEKLCDEKKNAFSSARPGTTYMVVDLGGGTADITVHEKEAGNKIKEVYKASGGPWGGTAIDHACWQFFISIIGGPVMSRLQREFTYDHLELLKEFECMKRTLGVTKNDLYTMKIPAVVNDICKEEHEETFKELVAQSKYKDDITFISDKIRLNKKILEDMFKKVTDRIVAHLKGILEDTEPGRKVSLVLLVGGLSESPYVKKEIQAGIPSNIKVLIPQQPGLAVLNGAIVYGRMPEAISCRIMRYTYGVKVERPFKEGTDPESKRNPHLKNSCMDHFKIFMKEGTAVERGKQVLQGYSTATPYQPHISIRVFTCRDKEPEFVTDDGCKLLGTLKIKISNPSKELKDFVVIFRFGSTSLAMIAIEKETKKVVVTAFALRE